MFTIKFSMVLYFMKSSDILHMELPQFDESESGGKKKFCSCSVDYWLYRNYRNILTLR
jgi:hypothetical protein